MATATQSTPERPSGLEEVTIWLQTSIRGGIDALAADHRTSGWSMLQSALNQSCKQFLDEVKPVTETEIAATFDGAPPAGAKPVQAWLRPDLLRAVAIYAANMKMSFSSAAGLLLHQYFETLPGESRQIAREGGRRANAEEERKRAEPMRAFEEKSAAKAREVAAEIGARRAAQESLSESLAMIAHIAGRFEPGTFPFTDPRARAQLEIACEWLAVLRDQQE